MSHGSQNWFELSGVSRNRGFEKSGVKLKSFSEANSMEKRLGSRYGEVRETEGSRSRDSTVFMSLNLFRVSIRHGAIINKNSQAWFLTNFDVNDRTRREINSSNTTLLWSEWSRDKRSAYRNQLKPDRNIIKWLRGTRLVTGESNWR